MRLRQPSAERSSVARLPVARMPARSSGPLHLPRGRDGAAERRRRRRGGAPGLEGSPGRGPAPRDPGLNQRPLVAWPGPDTCLMPGPTRTVVRIGILKLLFIVI